MRRSFHIASVLLCGFLATGVGAADAARVSGTIKDEAGQPVSKAKVTLEPVAERGERVTGLSNKMGNFLFDSVVPGEYRLIVEAERQALLALQAKAEDLQKKVAWEVDGPVRPSSPSILKVEQGFVVTCTATLGAAVEVTGAEGTTLVSPEQALNDLARRIQAGRCAEAMPTLEGITTTHPEIPKAHYLAGFCSAQLGHPDRAVESLAKTLELQPKFPGAALLSGQVLAGLGRHDEAETSLKREISNAANTELVADAWIALGGLYRDRGRTAEAVDAFQKVVTSAPTRVEPYVELAGLYTKMDDLEKAAAILGQAKEAGASVADAAPLLNVGVAYYRKKDYPHAQEIFKRVVEAGGNNRELATAFALLGRCQLHEGKTAEARTSLEKSLQLDAKSELAAETRQLLQSRAK